MTEDAPDTAAPSAAPPVEAARASFQDFGTAPAGGDGSPHAAGVGLELLRHVEIELSVELGRRSLPFAQVQRLATGSVIELDRLVGEPLVIYANGHPIGEGEVVVIGEQLGIRVTRLLADRAGAPA
ncbi:MAG: FliM/FliN family flagellar motor switch protein [Rubricoccaceae bacterium]